MARMTHNLLHRQVNEKSIAIQPQKIRGAMIISEKMDNMKLLFAVDAAVSDWVFSEAIIDKCFAKLRPMLKADEAETLMKEFKEKAQNIPVMRPSEDYMVCMRKFLVQRFDGWDTESLEPCIWNLLHDDVVEAIDTPVSDFGYRTAQFWLRAISVIANEDVEVGLEHGYDLDGNDEPQTTNLRAHALTQLARHLHQLVPVALRNKEVDHAWTALKEIANALRHSSENIDSATEIVINEDLNESWLLEWLIANTNDYLNGLEGAELKTMLVGSQYTGMTLSSLQKENKVALQEMLEDARADAQRRHRNQVEEDEDLYGSGSP